MCEYCNTTNILSLCEILSLFASTVTPVMIMVITLIAEKKMHKQSLQLQQKQFIEQINILEKQHIEVLLNQENEHKEELLKQDESNRLGIMPFLNISSVNTRIQNENLILSVNLKNSGMGIATNIRCVCLENDNTSKGCLVHKSNLYKYLCYQPIDLYSNTIQVNGECCIELKQEFCEEFPEHLKANIGDSISFTMGYNDVKDNIYRQEFCFTIGNFEKDKEIHAYRMYSYAPKLQS